MTPDAKVKYGRKIKYEIKYELSIEVDNPVVKTNIVYKIGLKLEPVKVKFKLKRFFFTVKSVLRNHIKQDMFWFFRQVVAYCCMK